jgi:hypothetical protein
LPASLLSTKSDEDANLRSRNLQTQSEIASNGSRANARSTLWSEKTIRTFRRHAILAGAAKEGRLSRLTARSGGFCEAEMACLADVRSSPSRRALCGDLKARRLRCP